MLLYHDNLQTTICCKRKPPVTDMNINISLKVGSGMRYKTTLACV